MKLFLQPSRISAHRIACIALYRALLEQCPRVQHLVEGWPATPLSIKHLVRKQFRRNQHVQSSRLVVAALQAGYEAEAMLRHAGDGDEIAKSKIMTILHEVERARVLSRANAAVIPPEKRKKRPIPAPYPGARPILESRPRPQSELGGSGLRKVPKFVNANGHPMLRFSKTHSPFLARMIQDKVKKEDRIHTRIIAAQKLLKVGKGEDVWDEILEELTRGELGGRKERKEANYSPMLVGTPEKKEGSWNDDIYEQIRRDRKLLNEEIEKKKAMTRKMLDIVSQEESLQAIERMQRKKARKKERVEKQSSEEVNS